MSDAGAPELVQARLQQAGEALEAAQVLHQANMQRQSVGRAYYAVFYAISTLLTRHGLSTSKHARALGIFDREFVKKGLIAEEYSRIAHELFDLRQRSDYLEVFLVSPERAASAWSAAERFLAEIRICLGNAGQNA
jgi:uncharacterized protein (UPF0332 family)